MKIIITEEQLKLLKEIVDIKGTINRLHGLSGDLKDFATSHLKSYTRAKNGRVSGLSLHSDLIKKIKDGDLPDGFDMGVDKGGYYIHTHRARSKSHEEPGSISVKEIRFIDSTG